jgi:hypothetical protein
MGRTASSYSLTYATVTSMYQTLELAADRGMETSKSDRSLGLTQHQLRDRTGQDPDSRPYHGCYRIRR